jgi:hypothetical protein
VRAVVNKAPASVTSMTGFRTRVSGFSLGNEFRTARTTNPRSKVGRFLAADERRLVMAFSPR